VKLLLENWREYLNESKTIVQRIVAGQFYDEGFGGSARRLTFIDIDDKVISTQKISYADPEKNQDSSPPAQGAKFENWLNRFMEVMNWELSDDYQITGDIGELNETPT